MDLEHKIVIDFYKEIAKTQNSKITIGVRENMALNKLTHLRTPVEFSDFPPTNNDFSPDNWIRTLHPTPALGVYPRTKETLEELQKIREGLNPYYGSTFGVYEKTLSSFVVMIRGFFSELGQVTRPLGVGITSRSILEQEWEEINLKRES